MTSRHFSTVESMTTKNAVLHVCDHAALPDLLSEVSLLVKSARELLSAHTLQNPTIETTDLDWLPYHLLGQVAALVHAAEHRALQQQNANQLTLLSQ